MTMRSSRVERPLLVVVLGPTAVGKTAVAIKLAQRMGCDVVSADSRQVYRQLDIGVARPSEEELAAVRHHLVAYRDVWARYSCGQYAADARRVLEQLYATRNAAILVGGSMLYVDAVCKGIDDFPAPDMSLREHLSTRLREEGVRALAAQLAAVDPKSHSKIDTRNGARVLRALEVTLQSGRPYSDWLQRDESTLPYAVVKIGLILPMEELTRRIENRVEAMMRAGLEPEARAVWQYKNSPALRTVGYRELFDYFEGRCAREEAIARIKVNTRRYAKRQMAWWRRETDIAWFFPRDVGSIFEYIGARAVGSARQDGEPLVKEL